MVRSRVLVVEREVLLDNSRTQHYRGEDRVVADRVVAIADITELILHTLDGFHIGQFKRTRIEANAMHDRGPIIWYFTIIAIAILLSSYGGHDLIFSRHPGAEQDRQPDIERRVHQRLVEQRARPELDALHAAVLNKELEA